MSANPHAHQGSSTISSAGAFLGEDGYLVLEKMRWRTAPAIVASIARDMGLVNFQGQPGFDVDACAEDAWHHAPLYYTAQNSALKAKDWRHGHNFRPPTHQPDIHPARPAAAQVRSVFMNCPWAGPGRPNKLIAEMREAQPDLDPKAFPGTARFVNHAWAQSRHGMQVAVLIGSSLDQWQREAVRLADEVWFGPRLAFLELDGTPQKQPPGAHMVLIFRPHVPVQGWPGGPRVRWDWDPR